jgi:hypothetical protein
LFWATIFLFTNGLYGRLLYAACSPLTFPGYWIFYRLLLVIKADMQLRQHMLEVLCRDGVLPASLDDMQQASAWVAMYTKATVHERDALLTIMGLRAKLQVRIKSQEGCRVCTCWPMCMEPAGAG